MGIYVSDGRKLLNVEYDDTPSINDMVDGMRVISRDDKDDEYAIFLLEPNGNICCYVLNEIYILGSAKGFENLSEAINAWVNEEV